MNRQQAIKQDKSFFGDFSEEVGMYCVFGSETGFAYSQHGSQAAADTAAIKMDKAFIQDVGVKVA